MSERDKIFASALALPREQRAELMARLQASLEKPEADEDASDAWASEIEARGQQILAGRPLWVDLDEAISQLAALNGE